MFLPLPSPAHSFASVLIFTLVFSLPGNALGITQPLVKSLLVSRLGRSPYIPNIPFLVQSPTETTGLQACPLPDTKLREVGEQDLSSYGTASVDCLPYPLS